MHRSGFLAVYSGMNLKKLPVSVSTRNKYATFVLQLPEPVIDGFSILGNYGFCGNA